MVVTSPSEKQHHRGLNRLKSLIQDETFLYIVKRILQGLLTILLVSLLGFLIIQLTPGSYIDTIQIDPNLTEETKQQYIERYGLDKPPLVQYGLWLWQIIKPVPVVSLPLSEWLGMEFDLPIFFLPQGDFGISLAYSRSVASLLFERMFATLILAVASTFITWAIAIPLGILSAVEQNRPIDRILRVVSYIGQGFPSFITALFLLFVAQQVSPYLPVGNMTSLYYSQLSPVGKFFDVAWHMILPLIALSVTSFAGLQRLMRGQLLDVMRQDYIQTARAKGLPENRVIYVHALRNAINPLITLLGFEFASLLSGAFIAEWFFNWPGLGRLILQAVMAKDLYLVMASLMMGAAMLIVGNLLADLLLKFVDPRIKLENLK